VCRTGFAKARPLSNAYGAYSAETTGSPLAASINGTDASREHLHAGQKRRWRRPLDVSCFQSSAGALVAGTRGTKLSWISSRYCRDFNAFVFNVFDHQPLSGGGSYGARSPRLAPMACKPSTSAPALVI
jgi:hypothetical protein